jgi:intein/homing endonuclease
MDCKIKLALLAGIVASDGHLDKNRNAVRIITSDAEFLVVIEALLKDLNVNYRVWQSRSGFGRERFVVYFNDKKLRAELEFRHNIPKGKKSGTIKLPEDLEHQELAAFVRGLFSGDGSVYSDNRTGKNYPQIT